MSLVTSIKNVLLTAADCWKPGHPENPSRASPLTSVAGQRAKRCEGNQDDQSLHEGQRRNFA